MPKILFNPTNEPLAAQYVGEDVIIPSGGKIRVDDARGRAVLNTLFPRGLCELEYGDEGEKEERKAEQGRDRNRAFKRKQIMDFNALNDQRKQTNRPYLTPEPFLKDYAKELGMVLYEPYSSTDESKREGVQLRDEIQAKNREIAEKDKALGQLQAQVAEMQQMMKQIMAHGVSAATEAPPKDDWDEVRKQVRGINRTHFANWVSKNFQTIKGYPEGVQAEIRDKYERMYGMPFPENANEAEAQAA